MKTVTFQAENMQSALEIVQKELGPEALVVSVRQIPGGPLWQVWKKPNIEIVAGVPNGEPKKHPVKHPEIKTTPEIIPDSENGIDSLDDLYRPENKEQNISPRTVSNLYSQNLPKKPVESKKTTSEVSNENFGENFDDLYVPSSETTVNSKIELEESKPNQLKKFASILPSIPIETAILLQKLIKQGVSEDYIYRVTNLLFTSMTEQTKSNSKKNRIFLEKQFEASINANKNMIGIHPKIICLIGTSGVGKTSTVAKLATYFGRKLNKKVTWICADTIRAGAIAEANTYVGMIGATLSIAYTPEDIKGAINIAMQDGSEYILVDTPAFNANRETSVLELGNLLTVIPKRNTWLVVPATAKEKDINQIYASVSHFRVRGLVVTKMDETTTYGPIFNILNEQKIPLHFLTSGTNVIKDLISAEPAVFVRSLFEERFIE
jgi:flagellar biosynthesis protein FlhF